MARDERSDEDTPRRVTPPRGIDVVEARVEVLLADARAADRRLRALEQHAAVLSGVQGQPGAIAQLKEEIDAVRTAFAAVQEDISEIRSGLATLPLTIAKAVEEKTAPLASKANETDHRWAKITGGLVVVLFLLDMLVRIAPWK